MRKTDFEITPFLRFFCRDFFQKRKGSLSGGIVSKEFKEISANILEKHSSTWFLYINLEKTDLDTFGPYNILSSLRFFFSEVSKFYSAQRKNWKWTFCWSFANGCSLTSWRVSILLIPLRSINFTSSFIILSKCTISSSRRCSIG